MYKHAAKFLRHLRKRGWKPGSLFVPGGNLRRKPKRRKPKTQSGSQGVTLRRLVFCPSCQARITRHRLENHAKQFHATSLQALLLGLAAKVTYDPEVDALRILVSDAPIEEIDQHKPGVILGYDKHGNIVGMEILDALSKFPALAQQVARPPDLRSAACPRV